MMLRRPIDRFLLRTLLWLAPLFVLWYVLAPLLLMPVVGWTHFALSHLFPHAIAAVEQQGTAVDIVTRFVMAAPADGSAPPGARGQVVFAINALKYAYGWPLLLALTLAAPTAMGEKLYRADRRPAGVYGADGDRRMRVAAGEQTLHARHVAGFENADDARFPIP